ncbi:uncharacterized protein BDR25DRAFT_384101 [Lindgomyces ingoldianus]|uniref:Uncharacterized protein n=1 Tax=Lindgomyces ingoldianus TaxID=673940 RepID=A0ACB6R634_9PLEO|nr:uncharacterized protein BDR25DRAFT_384101 [Lindgomyces ingoldianus]KAF2474733.1 hypothetical protein BDR25DRAFT_384101 [Lindgomyces ingoldianus]
MAAIATQRASALPRPNFRPIIEHATIQKPAQKVVKFDPKKHLAYTPPSQIVMMKDIGYPEDVGVSPVAVSQPFQLFSHEAIEHMRMEIFKPEVTEHCSYSSNIAACQLRGYASKFAPFTYDAWNHPETLAIISKIAGVELVPEMDYEIGHINFSVKTDEQTKEEITAINKQKRFFDEDEGIAGCPWEDDKPVVGWHTDSYPFVCVLMLSDCTNMVGGETALRTANGEVLKVRGPQEGCAVILQGRYITHQALRALGAKERITSVTSFRPRSPFMKDDSVLTTVRPISDLSELYYDFAEYRCEIIEERLRKERKEIIARRRARKKFNTLAHKRFLEESIAFLEHTNSEIVEDSKVIPGHIKEVNYPDVVVGAPEEAHSAKRARVE